NAAAGGPPVGRRTASRWSTSCAAMGSPRRRSRSRPCVRIASKDVLMPPVRVDPANVKTFESAIAFDKWLSVHHHDEDEVWIKDLQSGLGREVDHTQGGDRRLPLLGLDRRGAQALRR